MAIVFITNGGLQAYRFLADLDNFPYLLRTDLHLFRNLFRRWFTSQVLQQAAADANQAIDRLYHMDRNTNRTCLVGDSTRNRLTNPPGCIGTELITLGVVKLLDSSNQANIPLLDQIQQAHTATNILFCNTHDQAQVRLSQPTLGFLAIINVATIWMRFETLSLTALHTLRQAYLFLCGKQGHTTDLTQVHAHGIVQATFQVCNPNAEAILQIIPFGAGHNVHLILWTRLPICWRLFGWIQCIHRLFVLQFRKQVKRLVLIRRFHKVTIILRMSLMTYSINFKNIFRITQ